jgi:hypothetical protein
MSTTINTDNLITTIYTEDVKGNATLFGEPIERPEGGLLICSDKPEEGPFTLYWTYYTDKKTEVKTIITTKTYEEARTIKKEIEKVQDELYQQSPLFKSREKARLIYEEQRKEATIYDKMLKTFKTIVEDINDSKYRLEVHCGLLRVFDSFSNEIKILLQQVDNDEEIGFATFLRFIRHCQDFVEQTLEQPDLEQDAIMFAPLFRDYAKQLKELEDSYIKLLQEYGPKVDLDPVNYEVTITLLRDGKEKSIEFGEWNVQITRCKDEDRKKFKIDGPPADDGFTYFIFVVPPGFGQNPETIWVSKEEGVTIKKRLYQAQKAAGLYDD